MSSQPLKDINSSTGIYKDYWNEFYARFSFMKNESLLEESLRQISIRKYGDYCQYMGYEKIVNKKNKQYIQELDNIVDSMNSFGKSDLTLDQFERLYFRAKKIIYE